MQPDDLNLFFCYYFHFVHSFILTQTGCRL